MTNLYSTYVSRPSKSKGERQVADLDSSGSAKNRLRRGLPRWKSPRLSISFSFWWFRSVGQTVFLPFPRLKVILLGPLWTLQLAQMCKRPNWTWESLAIFAEFGVIWNDFAENRTLA